MAIALLVLTVVGAWPGSTNAADGTWTGSYYNNLDLSGSPVTTRDDGPTLDFVFAGSPAPGVNADNWSALWERTDTYAAGTYRLTVTADDGVRLFVDGNEVLDAWVNQPPTTYFSDVALSAGAHTVGVELYDVANNATIVFSIEDVATIPPGWQGEYFDNRDLQGAPARTRNDGDVIDFQWNDFAPGSPFPGVIPNDDFSVRWTRSIDFAEGVYQFRTVSDDGVRVYVDGQVILDYWIDQPATEHVSNKLMTPGPHTVVVEYYEAGGGAEVHFDMLHRPDLGGFVDEVIVDGLGLYEPTTFAFAPDGRIFFGRKGGEILVHDGTQLLSTPFYEVPDVNNTHDRGLLGLALDPEFASNGWVYIGYTYENNGSDPEGPKTNQVIRVRAPTPAGNVADPGTKQVLLGTVVGTPQDPSCEDWPANSDCIPVDHLSHAIGNIKFGPDGRLYVATGDGASYNTVDSRALRSIDVTSLAGKILRVDRNTGDGLPDNPHWTGDPDDNASKVWARGFRNDFRFNFRPGTNVIFSGDVGWDTWEEVNVIAAGANHGWPCYEGPFEQPGYAAFAACQALYGAGGVTQPIHWYEHPPDSAVVGGAFTGANSYPASYQDTFFWGDYARDEIHTLKADGNHALVEGSVDTFSSVADGPVQFEIGPDGDVYYLSLNTGQLRAIRFIGDNLPPVAQASATPTNGDAPLEVSFSSAGSSDPEGQPLSYAWDFGDGNSSSEANPTHAYTADGAYTATLTVTDNLFQTDTDTVTITVGNNAPTATITSPGDGTRYDITDTVVFSGMGSDPEDGAIPSADMSWQVVLNHCTDATFTACHPHVATNTSGAGGSFHADDHGDFTYYTIALTVEDSGGLQDSTTVTIAPNRVDLTFTASHAGLQITVDGTQSTAPFTRSVPRKSQHTIFAPSPQSPSGTELLFESWSDGGAQQHTITANADATYTAVFSAPTPTPTPTNTATATATATATSTPGPNPVTVDATIVPTSATAPAELMLTFAVGSSEGARIYYEISWGDGALTTQSSIDAPYTEQQIQRTFSVPGTYNVHVAVTDANGAIDAVTLPVTIHPLTDSDGDALPDGYEAQHACLDAGVTDGGADPDEDTIASLMEFGGGTNPCVADTDGDACNDGAELGVSPSNGGGRNPLDPYDFADVPTPALSGANPASQRNGLITLGDALAAVFYIGTAAGSPSNGNGVAYDDDVNLDGLSDGESYDRSTARFAPWRSGPPSSTVTLVDALVILSQVGHNCTSPPP